MFNDALSCVGKVNGLRATEWSYDEFCAQTSANSVAYPTAAAGVVADLADKSIRWRWRFDHAKTPPGSRDNTLVHDCISTGN